MTQCAMKLDFGVETKAKVEIKREILKPER
jgi:hypothetical protein